VAEADPAATHNEAPTEAHTRTPAAKARREVKDIDPLSRSATTVIGYRRTAPHPGQPAIVTTANNRRRSSQHLRTDA
jgi:hypothetical protein